MSHLSYFPSSSEWYIHLAHDLENFFRSLLSESLQLIVSWWCKKKGRQKRGKSNVGSKQIAFRRKREGHRFIYLNRFDWQSPSLLGNREGNTWFQFYAQSLKLWAADQKHMKIIWNNWTVLKKLILEIQFQTQNLCCELTPNLAPQNSLSIPKHGKLVIYFCLNMVNY